MQKLTCPYCSNVVTPPSQTEVVYLCHENDGSCPQTGYMLVEVTPDWASEKTAIGEIYEHLAGRSFDATDPDCPDFQMAREGFILPNGTQSQDLDSEHEYYWGVVFVRLLEDDKDFVLI